MSRKPKMLNNRIAPTLESHKEKINLQGADFKLINLIRSIGDGEIENIQIKDGVPVTYKTAWKSGEL
ncbi:MAG: hypothetical protein HQ596_03610 [Candidatus Saganbacteria bacterium]|nr:hypothetical protein [Candidatus Saganbacteria bacterium]